MDTFKFYEITHRKHVICNPTSEEKLTRLVELLRLPTNAQVADIACGKGEFLIRIAEAYDARGMGIDISPFYIADAKRRLKARASSAGITFTQMNGVDYKPDEPHSLDLASCIGASWIFGGHADTLEALISMVKPGGWVIVGEPFWQQELSGDYLEASVCAREDFGSHSSNAEAGERRGTELVHTIVSSKDDWDRYEGLQWIATAEYARTHPDDPDLTELAQRVSRARAVYLRWGRDTLGWAIWVVKKIEGNWTEPEIAPFSGLYRDFAPFVTPDGKYLLFYRESSTEAETRAGTWFIEKKGDTWSESQFLVDEYCLTTSDFQTFYFTTDYRNSTNRDIAMITYTNGSLSEPQDLIGDINSKEYDAHSWISADESFLIFDSSRPGGFDDTDIYVSFQKSDGSWSEGFNLGRNINEGHHFIPSVTPNVEYVFFASDGDIYWADAMIIDRIKQQELK